MSTRPVALYYRMLKYQPANLLRLQKDFELIELETPADDTPNLLAQAEVLFAPLGYRVDRTKIDNCRRLRVIASNTTGHPHIDVDYARSRGIEVACLKFAQDFLRSITPTAELTWGLILALTRNLVPAHRAALAGQWDRRPFGAPAMLSSLKLGVVGHGRLGSMVARYGRAFGMDVAFYDPFVNDSGEGAVKLSSLEELVAASDIITLHVPHEPETEGMIDRQLLARFKRGSWLVNTARGELLDWAALLAALESGHLAGAAMDVFEGEFVPGFAERFPDHPVLAYALRHDNLLLTPHVGGSTIDAWSRTEAYTIDMVELALRAAPASDTESG
ncbi:2-hydroxyacid dehydrogenase [Algihabitans albus]|uniref:2-hydroxyacid dehydrogenase n=1 Tax=Algihabitans albus TaxID=2164067 RepID=UPI000E5D775A|nr:NAD(P)-dependent oxidoreductase [Algihabitans albus]